ncbi:MAG: tripartite tricarboxylate transporter permease [Rhodospirillum sp.]|nr:tripartite tricarboxylate transporter permease [Rhodospirillum sp.]MCF8491467.1 tripartite tricarboxylate transporter permease [Rhodospirillum sp.]MCF8498875.1 tripartite tricarboxylate transporter permease [Rhodospirillum sp.]
MWEGILAALTPLALVFMTIGVVLGIIIGAIPGLTATFGIALLVPVTFLMSADHGMIMLAGIYAGAIYGGSISAVLLNIPGTPASIVSGWEGHALALEGKAPLALGIAALGSGVAGVFSAIALMFLTPTLAQLALSFGAPEYVMLVVFSLIIVVVMLDTPILANVAGVFIGLMLATVGLDPVSGSPRLTFGFYQLYSGLGVVAVLVGFFCMPQAVALAAEAISGVVGVTFGRVAASPTGAVIRRLVADRWLVLRASVIGTGLGILPAVGPESTPLVSHAIERRLSKEPERFGKGSESGLLAAEASVSANVGGSLIPLLALGIPGSGAAAVFIGALTLHGLRPGPLLFTEHPDIMYTFFAGFLLVNILKAVIGLFGARYMATLLRLPKTAIATFVTLFSIFGAYAVNNSVFDIWVMLGAAVMMVVLGGVGIPILPVVLAFILGGVLDTNIGITMARAGDWTYFLDRPIALGLAAICVMLVTVSIWRRKRGSAAPMAKEAAAATESDPR